MQTCCITLLKYDQIFINSAVRWCFLSLVHETCFTHPSSGEVRLIMPAAFFFFTKKITNKMWLQAHSHKFGGQFASNVSTLKTRPALSDWHPLEAEQLTVTQQQRWNCDITTRTLMMWNISLCRSKILTRPRNRRNDKQKLSEIWRV